MKNKFKKLVMLVLALSMVITLCACGGDSSATNGSESGKGSESNKNSELVSESETEREKDKIAIIPLSECFKDENRVWYRTSGTKKTSQVEAVYICKDGKIYIYGPTADYDPFWEFFNWTLGDISKMTDEEIIETIESTVSAKLKECLEAEKSAGDTFLPNVNLEQEYYEMDYTYPSGQIMRYFIPTADLKEYYDNLDKIYSLENYAVDTKFSLFTDDTGNYVSYEKMEFVSERIYKASGKDGELIFGKLVQGIPCDAFGWRQETDNEVYATKLIMSAFDFENQGGFKIDHGNMILGGAYAVYDALYGGMELYDGVYLLTRADHLTHFSLDKLGTEGIEVDPKTAH